jgi:tRNA (guanosine-2'-O-)-methyltransferase
MTAHEDEAPARLSRAEAVLAARLRGITVVLEDAHDPHNVSAVLRTCEAFGIQDVHLVAESQPVSDLNPKVSIGAERWLTLHRHQGCAAAVSALRRAGYQILVSHLDARATSLPQLPARARAAYVFGNERTGVTTGWLEAADATFVIPTTGFTGSLNLSVAVALTVYDRLFGRPGATPPEGDLEARDKSALRERWYEALSHGNPALLERYRAHLEHPVEPRPRLATDRREGAARRVKKPGAP